MFFSIQPRVFSFLMTVSHIVFHIDEFSYAITQGMLSYLEHLLY
nr:MAG TPA: hypothetical protein [Caudoviricetes sp.]